MQETAKGSQGKTAVKENQSTDWWRGRRNGKAKLPFKREKKEAPLPVKKKLR